MKYQRLTGTRVAMSDEDSELGDAGSDMSSEKMGDNLIQHEVVTKEWSLGEFSDRVLLKHIGDLTQCRVDPRPEKKTIFVKGDDLYHVDKALAKLDIEWFSAIKKASLPLVYDFGCTEGEVNVMLQLLPLKELKDRRLTTTLVSPSCRLIKNLGSQQIVVMIKDGNVHPVGQPRALDRNTSVEYISKLWAGSVSKPYQIQSVEENPMVKASSAAAEVPSNPFLPPRKTGEISQWVEQSAAQSASDPFAPPPPANVVPQRQTQAPDPSMRPQEVPVEHFSPRKRAGKIRKPKGAAEENTLTTPQAIAKTAEQIPSGSLADVDKLIRDIYQASAEEFSAPSSQGITLPTGTRSEASNKISSPTTGRKDHTQFNVPVVTPSVKPSAPSSRRSNHIQLPALQPPYMPALSIASTATSTNPHWAYTAVSSSKEGQLIDFTTPPSSVETPSDRIQTNNEVTSRQLKNTMRQRKPSPQIGHGSMGATSSYENVAAQLLELVRSARGIVNFQTTIGRLLIDPKSGTGEYKKKRFAIGQWPLVFPNKHGVVKLETTLTERLTSLASDADFVVDLRLPSGRRMFTDQPCQRKIVYCFTCSASHKGEDDVVIDFAEDETVDVKHEVWKAPKLYGGMNWHYPKRYWDARLTVHLSEHVSQEQCQAAQEIVDNLRISPSPDQRIVQLSTKCSSKILAIHAIQLRRETHHRSTNYPDLLLKLCEVQDFEIELPGLEINDHCRAYTNSRKQMVHENRIWWEASIASATATRLMEENKALEIGEKTAWTVKEIIGADVVRNMSFLARDIVTGIDSVGYHNKGPKIASVKEQSDTPVPTLGFW